MPQRSATSAALAGVREAIATTGKPGLRVGRQMHVGHDEAGADAADPVFLRPDLHVRLEPVGLRHALVSLPAEALWTLLMKIDVAG